MCVINSVKPIATEAVEDAAKLKADLVQLQSSSNSKSAEEMVRELGSSVALCDSILQKIQKVDEERELLEKQLQSKTEEVTKLNEELKLLKQAGECVCADVYVHDMYMYVDSRPLLVQGGGCW